MKGKLGKGWGDLLVFGYMEAPMVKKRGSRGARAVLSKKNKAGRRRGEVNEAGRRQGMLIL